jgi:hypothetical protein
MAGVVIVSPLRASDSWVWPPRTLRHFPSSFLWIKEALLSVVTAVIPVLLPLREVVPELVYLHREERVHSNIQPVPYDLCTHSEQERDTISKRQGDLVPVPCCCRGTAMSNRDRRHQRHQGREWLGRQYSPQS